MKKNASKKLSLSRETLRFLEEGSLGQANGGIYVRTDESCVNSCDPVSVRLSCATTRYTC